MKLTRDSGRDTVEFRGWTDLLAHALAPGDLSDSDRASRDASKDKWAGASWAEAVTLARTGWSDGARKVRELIREYWRALRPTLVPREDWIANVVGHAVDIGAYVSGVPTCWQDCHAVPAPARRLAVVLNGAATCKVETDELIAKGAAVAAAVEAAVLSGWHVRVDVVWCMKAGGSERRIQTWCPLVHYGQRPMLSLLAFVLAHPSCLRRILFSVWENLPAELRRIYGFASSGPYGYPRDLDTPPAGAVYVPANALQDPVAWVRRAISGQNTD